MTGSQKVFARYLEPLISKEETNKQTWHYSFLIYKIKHLLRPLRNFVFFLPNLAKDAIFVSISIYNVT